MKSVKIVLASLIMTSMTLLATTTNKALVEEIANLPVIKNSRLTIVDIMDKGSVYMVRAKKLPDTRKITFFLSKDKKVLVMGQGIDARTGGKIAFPLDMSVIKGKEAFSYGTGNKILYIFTDPECVYCKKFEKKMPSLAKDYTMKVYLFPLAFHKEAKAMSRYILDAPSDMQKGQRLIDIANDDTSYRKFNPTPQRKKELDALVEQQLQIGTDFDIQGTPTVLDANLKSVNWSSLK